MQIRCTRNTGFYGMGSPIEIKKDNKKWFYLSQNETKQIETAETNCTLQANFFLLKSPAISISDKGQQIELEITMNPMLIWIYVILFSGMLLIPILHLSIAGIFFLLVIYAIFLISMLNKAYLIKEKI